MTVKTDLAQDAVNGPAHYGGSHDVYEAIKVIEAWRLGFHLGNTVKYIRRAGVKNESTELEDLRKAMWYLQRKISKIEDMSSAAGEPGNSQNSA